jgi:peroxiredoxin
LSTPEGRTVTLSAYKGKKNVIVMFWKTNGLYCPFELNNLKERYPGLQKEGFEVLAVNKKEASAKVKGFAEKEGLPFPVLLDEDGKVCDTYDIGGIPVFLIINKEGMITWRGYRFPERYAELAGS